MKAKKSLGQNFLKVEKYLNKMVEAGELTSTDLVIEIGPGHGDLTEKILLTGTTLICIEKDRELIPLLEEKFHNHIKEGKLQIIEKDVLETDPYEITKGKPYKIVANIPFYITGAIIEKFLSEKHRPEKMVLVTQKEVAERIVEKDGKSSILSLSVKFFGEPKFVTIIPKGAFVPSPKVDSAIVLINVSENINKNLEKKFFDLIHAAFAHKRKQMRSNLVIRYSENKVNVIFQKLDLDPKIRAEKIKIAQWVEAAKTLL
ncbi:ribosomal RNA small subunit methyltransferase A [Candidatus Nomurabacteria bacterium]|nr:ribosomal RNA small subunit methyltransferase A [Candidatus Nomurabacteria bacterium]MCB9820435.1 ribosomal RNA small subunit methyltransferase A [Candidatus Nomurabacteria bacterium]